MAGSGGIEAQGSILRDVAGTEATPQDEQVAALETSLTAEEEVSVLLDKILGILGNGK